MDFDLIYWTPMCDKYFLKGSILDKCGKTAVFPDGYDGWGNTAWAATAGLRSRGLWQCLSSTVY